jgi:hypothetical protein
MHNILPTLEDGSSRLELFSSIRVGSKMAHNHTFACPVFALQNELAAGNSIPKWSPRARLGLNLGPSPMHKRNLYLVLNLSTGLVLPQYHCHFDDFFETTKYGGPDVAISSTWQQLAGLGGVIDIPSQSQTSRPMPEVAIPPELQEASQEQQDVTWDLHNNVTEDTRLTTPQNNSQEIPISQENEGALQENSLVSARTSLRGRARKMSKRMADSVSQRDFYGNAHMHYMASQSLMGETPKDLFHDLNLELQERMRNPIAFQTEMMGAIMYLHQALEQKDASQFVDAVVREINSHVENEHWKLVKRDSVPDDCR